MSVFDKAAARNTNNNSNTRNEREPSEFDGVWINLGLTMKQEGQEDSEGTFVRMPRGVALSDLKLSKVYDGGDPDYAARVTLMNAIITELQNRARNLEEGESVPVIALEAQLYRRKEEVEVESTPEASSDLAKTLFG